VCEGLPAGEYTVLRANPAAEVRQRAQRGAAAQAPATQHTHADSPLSVRALRLAPPPAQCEFKEDGTAVCAGEAPAVDAEAAKFMAAKRNGVGALGG
jgi:hypothetical protein